MIVALLAEQGIAGTIFDIASHVSTPLALAGLFAAAVFFIFRQILAKNIFPQLTAAIGADVLRLVIDRLFLLALVAMVLGFVGYVAPLVFRLWHDQDEHSHRAPPAVNADALASVVRSQLESRDYAVAWDTVSNALKAEPTRTALLDLQAEVAMRWIRDVHVTEPQTFGDVVDQLVPALYQTAQRWRESNKVGAADALAHLGWANFLKRRDGVLQLDVEGKYREALQLDPDNPFAHAMWGHWLIANDDHLTDAETQFAAALKTRRERPFVRALQLAALQWVNSDENTVALIHACNDMRTSRESLDAEQRDALLFQIYSVREYAVLAKLDQILPADEHLATYRWLAEGLDMSSIYRRFFLARLTEAAGDCSTAQPLYVSILSVYALSSAVSKQVRAGIDRCRRGVPQTKSELELLTKRSATPARLA